MYYVLAATVLLGGAWRDLWHWLGLDVECPTEKLRRFDQSGELALTVFPLTLTLANLASCVKL